MTKGLAFLDYAVIAVFFAVMIGVGVYYSRKSKSSDQFFGNDKTVPWWLSGISSDAVNQHINAIRAKLGASNRTEAVAIALRKHLLKI